MWNGNLCRYGANARTRTPWIGGRLCARKHHRKWICWKTLGGSHNWSCRTCESSCTNYIRKSLDHAAQRSNLWSQWSFPARLYCSWHLVSKCRWGVNHHESFCFQRQGNVDKHRRISRGVERTSRLREIGIPSCELHGQRQHRKTSHSCLETDFILVAAVLKFPCGLWHAKKRCLQCLQCLHHRNTNLDLPLKPMATNIEDLKTKAGWAPTRFFLTKWPSASIWFQCKDSQTTGTLSMFPWDSQLHWGNSLLSSGQPLVSLGVSKAEPIPLEAPKSGA